MKKRVPDQTESRELRRTISGQIWLLGRVLPALDTEDLQPMATALYRLISKIPMDTIKGVSAKEKAK